METALKTEIQEIVELVKTIPEPLQLRTLELLLQDLLDRTSGRKHTSGRAEKLDKDAEEQVQRQEKAPAGKRKRESEGLDPSTLPMRVKAFMKRTKVTVRQIERLFHIEDNQYEPIWALQTTKFSKTQVHIALLRALQRALTSGEFSFDREEVREECTKRNSLDKTNFRANFQNNAKYFSGLEKDGLVSLTDEGMNALASLVTELAGASDGD
ncbi:MAG: hypothetical protein ACLQG3_03725 [Terracidiphilus sp.]